MKNFYDKVEAFNKKNMYNLNAEDIFRSVEKVMKMPSGKNRDDALRAAFVEGFNSIAADYETLIRERIAFFRRTCDERYWGTASEIASFMEYAGIVKACAEGIDPNYRSEYLFGLSIDESKNILQDMYASYTRGDEIKEKVLSEGHQVAVEDLEFIRYEGNTTKNRNYATETPIVQANIREAYMNKKILEEVRSSRNIFWRWFTKAGRDLSRCIGTLDKVLKEVGFTQEAKDLAKVEMKDPALRADDRKNDLISVDNLYAKYADKSKEIKMKQNFFSVNYVPSVRNINDQIKASEAVYKMIKEHGANLSEEVKDLFAMNREKIKIYADAVRGKATVNASSADSACTSLTEAFEKKYPKFKSVRYEDVEKECTKEQVSVNVEKTDEKIKTEPKKYAPTVVKESPVKDN